MQNKKLVLLFIALSFCLIQTVYATAFDDNGISVYSVKEQLGLALGFTGSDALTVGGFILGLIFLLLILFPAVFILRKSNSLFMFIIIMGLSMVGVNVAMGLWPWWILLIEAMIIALMLAGNVRSWITGQSGA